MRSRGSTLIELSVVLVIVAVLAGMIVPRLGGAAGARQLRESARRMLITARYAREFAVTHRRVVRLVINADQRRFALECEKSPDEFVPLPDGIGRAETLNRNVRFAEVRIEPRTGRLGPEKPENCITFEPDGQADVAVITITDGRRSYSLTVMPYTGRAKLVKGTVETFLVDRVDLDE